MKCPKCGSKDLGPIDMVKFSLFEVDSAAVKCKKCKYEFYPEEEKDEDEMSVEFDF